MIAKVPFVQQYCSIMSRYVRYRRCGACLALFPSKDLLREHIFSHRDQVPYLCCVCGQNFGNEVMLRYHQKEHRLDKQHVCDICVALPKSRGGWEAFSQQQLRKYQCGTCGVHFKFKELYEQHCLNYHSDVPSYTCQRCQIRFSDWDDFTDHFGRAHLHATNAMRYSPSYTCSVCKNKSSGVSSLTTHFFLIHKTRDVQMCYECLSGFCCHHCFQDHKALHMEVYIWVGNVDEYLPAGMCKHSRNGHEVTNDDSDDCVEVCPEGVDVPLYLINRASTARKKVDKRYPPEMYWPRDISLVPPGKQRGPTAITAPGDSLHQLLIPLKEPSRKFPSYSYRKSYNNAPDATNYIGRFQAATTLQSDNQNRTHPQDSVLVNQLNGLPKNVYLETDCRVNSYTETPFSSSIQHKINRPTLPNGAQERRVDATMLQYEKAETQSNFRSHLQDLQNVAEKHINEITSQMNPYEQTQYQNHLHYNLQKTQNFVQDCTYAEAIPQIGPYELATFQSDGTCAQPQYVTSQNVLMQEQANGVPQFTAHPSGVGIQSSQVFPQQGQPLTPQSVPIIDPTRNYLVVQTSGGTLLLPVKPNDDDDVGGASNGVSMPVSSQPIPTLVKRNVTLEKKFLNLLNVLIGCDLVTNLEVTLDNLPFQLFKFLNILNVDTNGDDSEELILKFVYSIICADVTFNDVVTCKSLSELIEDMVRVSKNWKVLELPTVKR